MKLEITYKDWINAYEKNIKPLPAWWNNEELRKKEYDSFRKRGNHLFSYVLFDGEGVGC
jgi:hypothetical protein